MIVSRKYVILLFLVLFRGACMAQNIIKGKIYDENKQTISGANILLYDLSGKERITYTLSNAEGYYEISFKSNHDSLLLRVSLLGYKKQEQIVRNQTQNIDFTLQEEIEEIREIVVKAPPVVQSGDTLIYKPSNFANAKDRSIADVLSRLPGVEVKSDGQVLYQGKPINKYYIEGLDLLEGKYNLANKNLPFQEVEEVQIIENHQPIRVLDSLVFSDRAAINLKLKNKYTFTGQGEAGIGATPFLWKANLTPMLFSPQRQFLGSYQTNNTGEDLEAQNKMLTSDELVEKKQSREMPEFLSLVAIPSPPIPQTRWLNNQAHLASLNVLQVLPKKFQFKLNAGYFTDKQSISALQNTNFLGISENLSLKESQTNRFLPRKFNASAVLEKNVADFYLKNTFEISSLQQHNQANTSQIVTFLSLSDTTFIEQRLQKQSTQFKNNFQLTFKLRKQLFTLGSLSSLSLGNERLGLLPSFFGDVLQLDSFNLRTQQSLEKSQIFSHNYLKTNKATKFFSIESQIGFWWQKAKLHSFLQKENLIIQNDSLRNDNAFEQTNFYAEQTLRRKNKNIQLALNLPLHFRILNTFTQSRYIFTEPRLSIQYKLSRFWNLQGTVGYQKDFGDLLQIYNALIIKNYRLAQQNAPLLIKDTYYGNIGISFRNPVKGLFGYAIYSYQQIQNNVLLSQTFRPNGSVLVIGIEKDNTQYAHLLNGRIGKSFFEQRASVVVQASYSQFVLPQIINQNLQNVSNQGATWGLILEKDWQKLNIKAETNANVSGIAISERQIGVNYFQRFTANFFPYDKHLLNLKYEFWFNNRQTNFYHFVDISYRFTWKNTDFQLSCYNLLDAKAFVDFAVSQNSFVENRVSLRPMQFLLSVRRSLRKL